MNWDFATGTDAAQRWNWRRLFFWLTLAARRAIPKAREICEELEKEMTPEQQKDAHQRLALAAPAQSATPGQLVGNRTRSGCKGFFQLNEWASAMSNQP